MTRRTVSARRARTSSSPTAAAASAGPSTARFRGASGFDGVLPSSWADGSRGWNGWLDRAEYPRILDPPGGRIWTANARVVGGDMLAKLGDGSYEVGARARQIRERLMARDRFTVRDMLAIQMDARSEFLDRWRQLLLDTLTPSARRRSRGSRGPAQHRRAAPGPDARRPIQPRMRLVHRVPRFAVGARDRVRAVGML